MNSPRARSSAVFAVLIAVIASLQPSPSDAAPPTPFYDVPDPLPLGDPGEIVTSELVADAGGVQTHRVMYHSRSLRGEDIAVTGLVHLPVGVEAPVGGRPVVTVGHGSVGSADHCAPSLTIELDPRFRPWLDAGYIVAETDYEGLGTPGVHPHLVGESEARGLIDIVRAARNLPGSDAGSRFAASGFSQGGHGVLFVGEIAATWAPELTLVGVNAEAPGTEIPLAAITLSKLPDGTAAANLLITAAGFAAAYPDAQLEQVLTPKGLSLVHLGEEHCYWPLTTLMEAEGGGPALFLDIESAPPWDSLLVANDPGHRPTPVPIRIGQGGQDPTVLPFLTEVLFARLCSLGDDVRRDLYPDEAHTPSSPESHAATIDFVIDRFEGAPFDSMCPAPVASTTTTAAPTTSPPTTTTTAVPPPATPIPATPGYTG